MKLEDLKTKDREGNLCWFCGRCSNCKMEHPHDCDDFVKQSQCKHPEPVPGDFLFDKKGKTLSKGNSDEFGSNEAKVTLNTMIRHMGL